MYIYTLFYKDTGLYNRSIFVMPNDETAKKAMKINLMNPKADDFRNEVKLGNTVLVALCKFEEDKGIDSASVGNAMTQTVCNLKELLEEKNE